MGVLLNLGYLVAAVLTLPWFIYRIATRGDGRSMLLRFGVGLPPPAAGSIWLHGSSAGEIALLHGLVRRLETDFPETPLVITAYSSTGFSAARKAYPEHRVLFFPADFSFIVRRFLRRFDPRLVVIVESDFWPNFLLATQNRKIPVAVLNGKMSNKSYRIHARTRLVPKLLRSLPVLAVQNEEYASRLLKLGVSPQRVKVTGDMKYDLTNPAGRTETSRDFRASLGFSLGDVVIIGGSLHDRENEVLIESYQRLIAKHANVSLIIVPRYPTDVSRIEEVLEERALNPVRKTQVDVAKKQPSGRKGVLLVDTMGELSALYGVADIAFVGGSLFYRGSNKGGHNLIEPAVFGVPILFGPYNFSFRGTVQELLGADAGIQVSDAADLSTALESLLGNEHKRLEMGRRAREVVLRSQGVTDRNYELLAPLLEKMRERPSPPRFTVWSIAVYFLLPYALFMLLWKGMSYPAYWRRWPERFGYVPSMGDEKTIWVHAVSVGEVRSSSELVKALEQRYPDHRILVTTTTPTGSGQVKELFGDRVSHSYVPYDLPAAVRRFMDSVDPEFAVVAETEFWPNLFGECRRRHIPLLLVNVRVSQASVRGYKRVPRTTHAMLSNADVLCAQTERDARQLSALGVSRHLIYVTGNLKFDVPVPESLIRSGKSLREEWGLDRFVMIAASTHRGEEQGVLDAFGELRKAHPETLLVLVPRHPERFNSVARLCRRAGYKVIRRSQYQGVLEPGVAVLVGDTMGELQKLYVASEVAFVGGSLVPIGGHNLLEACAVGVPVIFGPHMFNVEEISEMAITRGAGRQVEGALSLTRAAADYLEQPALREKASEAALRLVSENRGALERTLSLIDSTLTSARLG